MLVSLRNAGVSPAGYVAFIVAAPVLDPVLFGALVIIVGFPAAVIYLGVAFVAALALALLAEKADLERFMKPLGAIGNGAGADAGTGSAPWQGVRREWRPAMHASRTLLRTMLPLLVVGVGIGMAITAFLPAETVARVPGLSGEAAIPAAAAVGTLFYVNTEIFVPIADALRSSGVGIGAVVALTIAGAGANIPEFVILSRLTTPEDPGHLRYLHLRRRDDWRSAGAVPDRVIGPPGAFHSSNSGNLLPISSKGGALGIWSYRTYRPPDGDDRMGGSRDRRPT